MTVLRANIIPVMSQIIKEKMKSPGKFATTKVIKSQLQDINVNASECTVRRKLKDLNFKACRPTRKPKLTPAIKVKRLNWAKQWRDKDVDFWRSVCFSNESTFEILQNIAQFVRRRRGEQFHSDCFVQIVKHSTKIMIWSVISGKGTGRLYVVKSMIFISQRFSAIIKFARIFHSASRHRHERSRGTESSSRRSDADLIEIETFDKDSTDAAQLSAQIKERATTELEYATKLGELKVLFPCPVKSCTPDKANGINSFRNKNKRPAESPILPATLILDKNVKIPNKNIQRKNDKPIKNPAKKTRQEQKIAVDPMIPTKNSFASLVIEDAAEGLL
ncbi:uncharacterized protein TNCV_1026481 [Trichonephila clavipes]|nr:uncharacterized protein TNCV_1026481 [Trichonephila clavipes]